MKRNILAVILMLFAFFFVYGQNNVPIDLVLLLNTSSEMSSSYENVNDYITGSFLSEFLRAGDTFHLIVFSQAPKLEIARRISQRGDVETIIGRLLLQYPVENGNNLAAAITFTENYVSSLPSRPKKIVLVTTGGQDINNVVNAAKDRLRARNATFDYLQVTSGQPLANLPRSGRDAVTSGITSTQGTVSAGASVSGTGSTSVANSTQGTASAGISTQGTGSTSGITSQGTTSTGVSETGTASSGQQVNGATESGSTTDVDTKEETSTSVSEKAQGSENVSESEKISGNETASGNEKTSGIKTSNSAASGESTASSAGFIILIIFLILLVLGLIIFLVLRRRGSGSSRSAAPASPRRQEPVSPSKPLKQEPKKEPTPFADHKKELADYAAQPKQRTTPYSNKPLKPENNKQVTIDPDGIIILKMFVEDQSLSIGKRNTHSLKSGYSLTVGGGKSDFLIFLVPVPPNLGELHRNGSQLTFIPRKPKYFPDLGSNELRDCLNKTIRVISDKNYEIHFRFEIYEDPLLALNKVLHSIKVPG